MTPIDPQNFLAFHTVAEFVCVVLACLACWIAWHGAVDRRRGGMSWLGACLLAGALLDSAHALSYPGMPVFVTPADTEKAIFFWLAARVLMTLGLAGATWLEDGQLTRTGERRALLAALLAFDAAVAWLVLAHREGLPHTFVPGQGLTALKLAIEWGLIAALCAVGGRAAWLSRTEVLGQPARALRLLATGCAVAALAEWCFTRYADTKDIYTVVGHLLKLVAYYLIYRAVYLEMVRLPWVQLRESEERLRALFNAAPDAIVVIDRAGRIEHANPQVKALFGHEPAALFGHNVAALMPEAQALRHGDFIQRYLATGDPRVIGHGRDIVGRHADGRPLQLHLTVGEMRLPDGPHFIGFVRDVSERIEQQRRQDELQRQLMQAQKMEALGQLTGGVAHDFNNILAGVLGLSKLTLEHFAGQPSGKPAEYLREIVKVSERGRDLVAKMLAFSRREALPPAAPIELGPAAQEVLRLLRRQVPEGIALEAAFEPGVPAVRLGPTELHQLLTNLVLNARDALGARGRIQVSLSSGAAGEGSCSSCAAPLAGDWVQLTVSDNGEGMPPERLRRIFEPFYTTKPVGQGSGLGLSMVQSLVHASGGHVVVHSEPGRGTSVRLLLPAAGVDAARAPEPAPAAAPPPIGRLRVWVVDDDPVVSLCLSEILRLQGHAVEVFNDPQNALARFAATPDAVDLVVTDQSMPGLRGDELAQRLLGLRPALPVLLCTGYSDDLDQERARLAGIRQLLHKPFDAHVLLDAVRACQPH
jgi:PAS domain S-box-containing protein